MRKRSPQLTYMLPFTMARLAAASWETIFHRMLQMAQGACTAAEYQRMMAEKVAAMEMAAVAAMTGRGEKAVMAPFLRAARANARRLRTRA
jgi:hypothetical protein